MKRSILGVAAVFATLLLACSEDSSPTTSRQPSSNTSNGSLSQDDRDLLKDFYEVDYVVGSAREMDLLTCDERADGKTLLLAAREKVVYTCVGAKGRWIADENDADVKSSASIKSSSSMKISSSSTPSSSSGKVESSRSSSSVEKIEAVVGSSSSSAEEIEIIVGPSSSATIIDEPDEIESSSGTAKSGLGQCAAMNGSVETSSIAKNSPVRFRFSPGSTTVSGYPYTSFLKATYDWNYAGGTLGAIGADGVYSAEVSYAAAALEPVVATVRVTMSDGNYEDISCAPLKINGDPITGCTCASAAATVDVATSGTATWSVTGCTSASDIVSYEWVGATGTTASGTREFAEKGESLTPKVKVGNSDNTVETFTCNEVKAIDSRIPDYEIVASQQTGAIPIPAGVTSVHINVPTGGSSCVVFCNTTWTQEQEGKIEMTVGGQSAKGAYNVTVTLPAASCSDSMVEFELSAPATCGVQ